MLSEFDGPYDSWSAPPSPTIAASPTQVMEMTNTRYAISDRSGSGITGTVDQLAHAEGVFLSDPQLLWDPSTRRFYYSMMENRGTSEPDEGIAWGFSKTSTPSSAADFCSYFSGFNFGHTSFLDRDSLGDTRDFLVISGDRFNTSGAFVGTDVTWIAKPGPGSTCPPEGSVKSGIQSITNPDGSIPYAPTAARQVDAGGTGWVVATSSYSSSTSLTLWGVTRNSDGTAEIGTPVSLAVPPYNNPPRAPQAGKTASGEPAPTLQTRIYLTQAYLASDPRLGHDSLWTAHTIAGGAGTQVRWYEINPHADSTDQVGTISDPSLWVFNATVAPDRLVNAAQALFGSDAVITVNTSSPTSDVALQVVSKRADARQSRMRKLRQSPGPDVDYTCFQPSTGYCRWGDYSGTAPDPGASPKGKVGGVWQMNQWNVASTDDTEMDWRTLVALVRP
jgi:hypothetical protein